MSWSRPAPFTLTSPKFDKDREPIENFDVDEDGHCALLTDFETAALRQQVDIRKRVAILPEAQWGWDRLTGDPVVNPESGEGE